MDKKAIIKNFSRYACCYDRYADVQKLVAVKLLGQIKQNNFKKILEIGCGTGNYTMLLKEKFGNAKLKSIDISDKMIEIAQEKLKDSKIEFIVADAEEIQLDEEFDIVTSNACFQWFEDLERTLIKYKNILKKDGIVSFSIFGPHTFWELDTSLKYTLKDISVCATNFVTDQKIKEVLNKNFKESTIKEFIYEESFDCLKGLLDKIKYTGTGGEGINGKVFFSPSVFKKAEQFYLNRFGQIKATYQVFLCHGTK